MAAGKVARLALDRDRILREYRGSVKQGPMMLAAIETVAKTDPAWAPRRDDPNVAAQATAHESVHLASPLGIESGSTTCFRLILALPACSVSAMPKLPAELLLARETRIAYGPVPDRLLDAPLPPMSWQMKDGKFLLRAEGDHYFYYQSGDGVTVHRGADADTSEESLWLNGSVYAAIASMNGLLPIHASAVAHEGSVFAFTGPAGAGKSTIAAALGRYGLPMFCDDTLVLDLSCPDRIMCLPGHKRLKLRLDAFELTGAGREEKVSRTYDKYYAAPTAGIVGTALPIAKLIFLEEGPNPAMTPISGSERFVRMQDDHQTSWLFAAARQFDRGEQFSHRARLARQIEMTRFVRPCDAGRFDEGASLAARYVMKPASVSA